MAVSTSVRSVQRTLFLFSYFLLLFCSFANGAIADDGDLAALEQQLQRHPSLQVLRYQAQVNHEHSTAAMGLPDPVVALGINNFPIMDPSFNEFIPTNKAIGVSQNIPNARNRKARAVVSTAQADGLNARWQQRYAAMRGQLIALLHDQHRIREQQSLLDVKATKLAELDNAIESEIDAGEASVFKLSQVKERKIELARQRIVLEQARLHQRLESKREAKRKRVPMTMMMPNRSPQTLADSVPNKNY